LVGFSGGKGRDRICLAEIVRWGKAMTLAEPLGFIGFALSGLAEIAAF